MDLNIGFVCNDRIKDKIYGLYCVKVFKVFVLGIFINLYFFIILNIIYFWKVLMINLNFYIFCRGILNCSNGVR